MTMRLVSTARIGLAAAIVALATTAAPALAHVSVERTTPKAGSTAKRTAPAASVTFSAPILTGKLSVTGPDGARASVNEGARDPRSDKRLLVQLRRGLKPGRYTATWRAIAGDGHREHGSFTFRLK
jgi:methionine-rich copper-binding protein CopC